MIKRDLGGLRLLMQALGTNWGWMLTESARGTAGNPRTARSGVTKRETEVATFAGGKIEAYVGPPGLGATDDLEKVIVDFIAGSKATLDIAMLEALR